MIITEEQLQELHKAFEDSYEQYKAIVYLNKEIYLNHHCLIEIKGKKIFAPLLLVIILFLIYIVLSLGFKQDILEGFIPLAGALIFFVYGVKSERKVKELEYQKSLHWKIASNDIQVVHSLGYTYPQSLLYKASFMYFYSIVDTSKKIETDDYIGKVKDYISTLSLSSAKVSDELNAEINFYQNLFKGGF